MEPWHHYVHSDDRDSRTKRTPKNVIKHMLKVIAYSGIIYLSLIKRGVKTRK